MSTIGKSECFQGSETNQCFTSHTSILITYSLNAEILKVRLKPQGVCAAWPWGVCIFFFFYIDRNHIPFLSELLYE